MRPMTKTIVNQFVFKRVDGDPDFSGMTSGYPEDQKLYAVVSPGKTTLYQEEARAYMAWIRKCMDWSHHSTKVLEAITRHMENIPDGERYTVEALPNVQFYCDRDNCYWTVLGTSYEISEFDMVEIIATFITSDEILDLIR